MILILNQPATTFSYMERIKYCCKNTKGYQFANKKQYLFEDREKHYHCPYCISYYYNVYLRNKRVFQKNNPNQLYFGEIKLFCGCTICFQTVVNFLNSVPTKSTLPIDNPSRFLLVQNRLQNIQLNTSKNFQDKQNINAIRQSCSKPCKLLSQVYEKLLSKSIRDKLVYSKVKVEERQEQDEQFSKPKMCKLDVIIPTRQQEMACFSCRLAFKEQWGLIKMSGGHKNKQIECKCWKCCINQDFRQKHKVIDLRNQVAFEQFKNAEHMKKIKKLHQMLIHMSNKQENDDQDKVQGIPLEQKKPEKEEGNIDDYRMRVNSCRKDQKESAGQQCL